MAHLGPDRYEPTQSVRVLFEEPGRVYERLALIDTQGASGASRAAILNSAKRQARRIGAHAIIPVGGERRPSGQALFYNPALGGYQTIQSGGKQSVQFLAIRFVD